jgi:peptidoglycan/xylan/chitin deacetylase (PgdA/CDA1 family)
MRRSDVVKLAGEGHEIGFHTLRHELLPALDDGSLDRALNDGRAALEACIGEPLRSIAYPHGRGSRRVAAAARAAGFTVGFTSAELAVQPKDDALALGRLEAPFSSTGHLAFVLARALLRAYRS